MKKTVKAFDLIQEITSEFDHLPPQEVMVQEIKMMNFKVRPVSGDIFHFKQKEQSFLESLWKMGRIEEIVAQKVPLMNKTEQESFFTYLENLQMQLKGKQLALAKEATEIDESQIVEFEIIRDTFVNKRKLN